MQRLSRPNVSAMDTDGPSGGLHRPTAEVQADRGLRFATGTSLTSTGRRSRPSRLEDKALLGRQVRRRSGAGGPAGCFGAPVWEAREKPVSKGTGPGRHLRFRVMWRLD